MPMTPLSELKCFGGTETGTVYEQKVRLVSQEGEKLDIRRIVVKLNQPTRDGEMEMALFTNVSTEDADSLR